MDQITWYSEFKTLRKAYCEVQRFIENETSEKVSSIHTKIEDGLGIAGDDSYELIEKFITKYNLDSTSLDPSKHFLSEGELSNSGTTLLTILILPVSISFWLIKLITSGKVDWTQKQIFPDFGYYRKTTDITFGDILTWYITGKYKLRKDVKMALKTALH